MKIRVMMVTALLASLPLYPLLADQVTMRDGRVLSGALRVSEGEFRVRQGEREFVFDAGQVACWQRMSDGSGRVVLANGRVLDGIVSVTGGAATLDMDRMTVQLAGDGIESYEPGPTARQMFLRQVAEAGSVEALFALIDGAKSQGLAESTIAEAYQRVIAIDPEQAEANRALGRVRRDGRWMSNDEYRVTQGCVRRDGQWLSMESASGAAAKALHEREMEAFQRRMAAGFHDLASRDQDRVSQACRELRDLDRAVPGLVGNVRAVRDYVQSAMQDQVVYDGNNSVLELRVTHGTVDIFTGIWLTLGSDLSSSPIIVFLPLPVQDYTSIKTVIIAPGAHK